MAFELAGDKVAPSGSLEIDERVFRVQVVTAPPVRLPVAPKQEMAKVEEEEEEDDGVSDKVMLIGNLVQGPEVRRTSAGVAVSTLRVAVNESYQSKSGEQVERAVFLDVDVWIVRRKSASSICPKGLRSLSKAVCNWIPGKTGKPRKSAHA